MTELSKNQIELLENFIAEFLPKSGNKRKNSGNELNYVTTTLNRVFKQNFGFNLTRHQIIDTFINLGYIVFYKEEIIDFDKKTYKHADKGNIKFKQVGLGGILEAPYTFIDISAETIRYLMKTTAQLPENTKSTTYHKAEKLKTEIFNFKSKQKK